MRPDKRPRNSILEKIDVAMFEFIRNEPEEAVQILKDSGLDPEEESAYGAKVIRKFKFLNQALNNKRNDESLLTKALEKLRSYIIENSDHSSEVLISLLRQKAPHVQFRSLEKLEDEEIREILNDVDLASLLEELERNSED